MLQSIVSQESFHFRHVSFACYSDILGGFVIASFLESVGLFGSLMSLVLLGRAAFVFPLSVLSNYSTKSSGAKISIRQMVTSGSFSHLFVIKSLDTCLTFDYICCI